MSKSIQDAFVRPTCSLLPSRLEVLVWGECWKATLSNHESVIYCDLLS